VHSQRYRILREKLAKIERELAEAEELKSLKPSTNHGKPSLNVKKQWRTRSGMRSFAGTLSSDGFLVVAGKDTVSNEVLVKKHTAQEDVVFSR